MRVAIDTRWIFEELSGVGQVTRQLVTELARIDQDNEYVLLFDREDLRDLTVQATGIQANRRFTPVTVPCGVFSPRSQWSLPRELRRLEIDVFHSPNYMIPYRAFPREKPGRVRCVVTIHDVIPLLFPDHAPRSRKARMFPLYRRLMLETARRADIITTVSRASRQDIIEQLAIPPGAEEKVISIYNGVTPPETTPAPASPPASRLLLYVGRFDPYKNVPLLVRAFADLRRSAFPDLRLRIIGPPDPRYPEAHDLARELEVHGAIDWCGYVDVEELARAYREAAVLVQPSRYEGFGLPVLEAMAAGTPVVCTRAGALPEVVGEAAIVVEPDDDRALADAVTRVLTDAGERARLREAGLERVKSFTWERTARETLAAYHRAAELGRST